MNSPQDLQEALNELVAQLTNSSQGDLDGVVYKLEKLQALQQEHIEELKKQSQALQGLRDDLQESRPHGSEDLKPDSPSPIVPGLIRQIQGCSRLFYGVSKPLYRTIYKPTQRLLWTTVQWALWKPLNYVLVAPLSYGLKRLTLTYRILQFTESIEQYKWEKRLDNLSVALGELGLVKLTASLLLFLGYVFFVLDIFGRGEERNYQAWGVINSGASVEPSYSYVFENKGELEEPQLKRDEAGEPVKQVQLGSTGEGGRISALEALYADNQPLAGLQAPGAYLPNLNLEGYGCFQNVYFKVLSFEFYRCWKFAKLSGANLEGADLRGVKLKGADLWSANFQWAFLAGANFDGAALWYVKFNHADLTDANLEGAALMQADFENAILDQTRLLGAMLLGTKLAEAQGLKAEQLQEAYLCKTELPPDLSLNADRDCEKLAQFLVDKGWWKTTAEAWDSMEGIVQEDAQ